MSPEIGAAFERLVVIMERLRGRGGCPWDQEQDLRSLRPYLVEETFEVLDEMDRATYTQDWGPLAEELGDLLFQIVFHSQLASELGKFNVSDVCNAISDKIERRHPHVFGDKRVASAQEVLANWAVFKAQERLRKRGHEGSVLDGVPTAAPALLRSERLGEKASRIGFDWASVRQVREKVSEELGELDLAIKSGDRDELEHELGDVLFSLANLARHIRTPAEDALRQANQRFTSRFQRIERRLHEQGVPFGQATLAQLEELWAEAKSVEALVPVPSRRPTSPLTGVTLPIPKQRGLLEFWDFIALVLHWGVEALSPMQRIYRAGAVEIRIREVDAGDFAAQLELSAASAADVEYVFHSLSQRRFPNVPPPRLDPDRHAVFWGDPANLSCRYGWMPAETSA